MPARSCSTLTDFSGFPDHDAKGTGFAIAPGSFPTPLWCHVGDACPLLCLAFSQ